MEWDVNCRAFFVLLRAGLWNREPEQECFPLTPEVWEQVYRLACKQTVEGVIYDGIMRLPAPCLPPKDLLLKWVVRVNSIEVHNRRMTLVAGEINALFEKEYIKAFLMKGQGVAALYDNPLHRVCGDIDWFFPEKKDFECANRLMKKNGVTIERQSGFSVCYSWDGFMIEHHCNMLDISDPFLSGYLSRLRQRESDSSVYLNVGKRRVILPSPMLTHLSVNSHILKHQLSFGISIRQLCDSAYVCRAYHSQTEQEALSKTYRKLGISRWMRLLNRLLVEYLGMPAEYLPFPLTTQQNSAGLMKDILRGGNFGLYGGPFVKVTEEPQWERKRATLQLLVRFYRYCRYAPREAFWFPVMHTYSRLLNRVSG